MVSALEIATRQAQLTTRWHQAVPGLPGEPGPSDPHLPFSDLMEGNHRCNFSLWHEEDTARRDDLGFEAVYRAKRAIDRLNQQRNNFTEAMDQALFMALKPRDSGCPRHSETPGMIVDRLSILALKEYHMHEETIRDGATPAHHAQCSAKLTRIRQQRDELTESLAGLLDDIASGRRTFSVYFQFKMYNDPALNPQLYRQNPRA
jgi:hypothetical protein